MDLRLLLVSELSKLKWQLVSHRKAREYPWTYLWGKRRRQESGKSRWLLSVHTDTNNMILYCLRPTDSQKQAGPGCALVA